jgi:hypothetical protein
VVLASSRCITGIEFVFVRNKYSDRLPVPIPKLAVDVNAPAIVAKRLKHSRTATLRL